jgi:transposase
LGRRFIDPVIFFKLQLVMLFAGIRSDHQFMETASRNLAHRWYLERVAKPGDGLLGCQQKVHLELM